MAWSASAPASKLIAQNRRARHDFHLEEMLEAGVVLTGTEVKSCRTGKVNLTEAYAVARSGEAWLMQCHISPYTHGNRANHDPMRPRKLLLHQDELERLEQKVAREGRTIVPLRLYFKHGLVKAELAVARGKKTHDKRASIAERDAERRMRQQLGRRR